MRVYGAPFQTTGFRTPRWGVSNESIARLNSGPDVSTAWTIEAASALKDEWQALEMACTAPFTVFQTYDWCMAWWRNLNQCDAIGMSEVRPVVITVRNHGVLQLVCPMMVRRLAGGSSALVMLGEPHTQYANVVLSPNCDAQHVLSVFWQAVCELPGIDTIRMTAVPATSVLAAFLQRAAVTLNVPNETALMDFSVHQNWSAYQASLGRSLRRGRAKRRNKFDRSGEVEFKALWPGEAGFEEAIREAIHLKQEWVRETGRVSAGLSWPGLASALCAMPGCRHSMQGLVVHALRRDGRNVALELGFIRHGEYSCFLGGFDWSCNELSPGKVQIEASFKWFMEHGIARYDFLPNPAAYKADWTNLRVDVSTFVHPLTARGRLTEAMVGPEMKHRAKTMYYRLPHRVRSLASTLLQSH